MDVLGACLVFNGGILSTPSRPGKMQHRGSEGEIQHGNPGGTTHWNGDILTRGRTDALKVEQANGAIKPALASLTPLILPTRTSTCPLLRMQHGQAGEQIQRKISFFFPFFFLFPPGISVQLDPFPDPLHLAAAQMLVLAEGAAARARRRQPLLDALTADQSSRAPAMF